MTEEEIEKLTLNLREVGHLRRPALEVGTAYRAGWEEGLFAPVEGTAPHSEAIALFDGMERLAFWQGHRDGRSTREALFASGIPTEPHRMSRELPTPVVDHRI
jgi:hypothetical protein